MANSISAAPAVLAEGVIGSLKNKLPVLSGISTVFSARPGVSGLSIQVPLIGVSTATTFGSGGYLTQDDATVTSSTVTLVHYKVSSRFSPSSRRSATSSVPRMPTIPHIYLPSFFAFIAARKRAAQPGRSSCRPRAKASESSATSRTTTLPAATIAPAPMVVRLTASR